MHEWRRTGCKTPKETAQIRLWTSWVTQMVSYRRTLGSDLQVGVGTKDSLESILNREQKNIDVCGRECFLPMGMLS